MPACPTSIRFEYAYAHFSIPYELANETKLVALSTAFSTLNHLLDLLFSFAFLIRVFMSRFRRFVVVCVYSDDVMISVVFSLITSQQQYLFYFV